MYSVAGSRWSYSCGSGIVHQAGKRNACLALTPKEVSTCCRADAYLGGSCHEYTGSTGLVHLDPLHGSFEKHDSRLDMVWIAWP
jgi:hypothetical protein